MAQQGDRMRVLLDLTRYEDQELDISGKFNARVGDAQDLLPLWFQNNGFPVDLRQYKVVWGGTDANMVVHQHERAIADFKSYRGDQPTIGKFTLAFDNRTFNIPGVWDQFYIRLVDADDNTISSVDLKFDVFDDSFFAHAGNAEDSYVEQFQRILQKVTDEGAEMEDQLREWLAKYKQSLLDAIHEVNDPKDGLYVRYQQLLDMTKQIQTTLKAAQFHDRIFQYATVEDMKEAVMPLPGDMAATQGWVDSDDARGGFWRIRVKHDGEVPDGKNTILLGTGYVAERNYGIVQDMDPIHIYDTVADMKAADLAKGQTARTLGEYKLNDGGGATYKITDSPSGYHVDLKNSLKAEKINTDDSNYYDEIKQTTKRINDTDVYFVDIPKLDKNGQPITPYIAQNGADRYFDAATKEGGYHDSPTGRNETPTEYARSEHTTLTVNGSASVMVADNTYVNGNIIGNGKILNTWLDQPSSVHVPANFVYVGIMKDRSLREFPFGTSAQQMLDAGVQNSWLSYWRLIRDGSIVDNSMSKSNEGHTRVKDLNPHLGLGIKEDGTLVIAACDGRTDTNLGLTSDDFAEAMKDYGCVNAWHMDGGGSTSVTLRGSKINRNIDGDGTRDRAIPYTFNIKKPGAGGGTANAYSQTGEVQQRVLQQVMPDIHHLNTHTTKWFGQFSFKSDDELENWLNNGLPQLVNWIDYPEGVAISGIIATQYNNSAPGLQIGTTNSIDWYFKYEASGSHRYGHLIMDPEGYSGQTVIRDYHDPNWTRWYGLGVSHSSSPVIVAQGVDKCYLNQAGAVVSVDVILTTTAAMAWDVIARGFPKPAPADIQPIQILGQTNNASGQIMIDHGGQLIMKGKPDLYQTHFVYLTNGVD